MQQIYRRMPMPKCSFNKVLLNFIEIALRYACCSVNFLHILRTPFLKKTSGWLFLLVAVVVVSCSHVSDRQFKANLQ